MSCLVCWSRMLHAWKCAWTLGLLLLACHAAKSGAPQLRTAATRIIKDAAVGPSASALTPEQGQQGHARGLHEASARPAAGGAAKHHESRFPHRQAWHYQPSVPYHILDRSRGYMGDDNRLRVFAARLMLGLPAKVALLGGSVSLVTRETAAYDAGWASFFHKWLELAFTPCGDDHPWPRTKPRSPDAKPPTWQAMKIAAVDTGAPTGAPFTPEDAPHLSQNHPNYLATHHTCNSSNIEIVNLATYATSMEFLESCRLHKVPSDVNLVILEFGINDRSTTPTTMSARCVERMLRTLLALPSRPAVVFFDSYSLHWSMDKHYKFTPAPEESHMQLAAWYGSIQLLTLRSVLHHSIMAHPEQRDLDIFFDAIHPTHTGNILFSDVLVHLVQGVVRRLKGDMRECAASHADHHPQQQQQQQASAPAEHDSELCRQVRYVLKLAAGRARSLPEAIAATYGAAHLAPAAANQTHSTYLLPGWASNISEYHDLGGEDRDRPGPSRVRPPLDPELPPPLNPGNWASRSHSACAFSEDLPGVVARADPGWVFMDETGTKFKRKYGYIANATGAALVLAARWCRPLPNGTHAAADARSQDCSVPKDGTITLLYLQSEVPVMGKAAVVCEGKCECDTVVIDAYKKGEGSITAAQNIQARPRSDVAGNATDCYVRVSIWGNTSSQGRKFKVIGLATGMPDSRMLTRMAGFVGDGFGHMGGLI